MIPPTLKEKEVSDLAFVCLTHPHEDHYCGLRQVLEHPKWRVHAVWRPAALPHQLFKDWVKAILKWREKDGSARARAEASELTDLFAHVNTRADIAKARLQVDVIDPPLKRCFPKADESASPPTYEFILFAPQSGQVGIYEGEINRAMDRADPEKLYNLANAISIGLVIRYGDTCVVLSGDMTNSAWSEIESRLDGTKCSLHVVKVPHHGSKTGYTQARWRRHCSREQTVAVVFPFHRYQLPKADSRAFFASEAASVKYTVHPEPKQTLVTDDAGIGDHASILVRQEFKARQVRFATGRWSLSLSSGGVIESASAYGDATEISV